MATPFQNFVFTDPVAAQQAVQMAQLAANADAEKGRALTATLQALTQQNVARENAANNRALSQAQLAQNQKQFETTSDYNNRALAAKVAADEAHQKFLNDQYADRQTKEAAALQYRQIQDALRSGDPPTESELRGMWTLQTPDVQNALLQQRRNAVASLKQRAGAIQNRADIWNKKLKEINPKTGKQFDPFEIRNEAKRLGDDQYLDFNFNTGFFEPLIKGPREDASEAVVQPQVQSIGSLLGKVNQTAINQPQTVSGWRPLANPAGTWGSVKNLIPSFRLPSSEAIRSDMENAGYPAAALGLSVVPESALLAEPIYDEPPAPMIDY